jgi:lactoylglutathione lyase
MPRIVHIAIKVDDLEKATKFYEEVFGFRQTGTGYARGHVSRHLTDGNIDVALMLYDSEDVEEAQLSGPGPCIHHWGIEVEDRDSYVTKIKGQWRYDHFRTWGGRVEIPRARWHGSRNRRSRSLQKENGGGACITGAENTKRPTNSSFFGNLKTAKTGSARSAHRAVIELRNRRWPNRELA